MGIATDCGALVIGGFDGPSLPRDYAEALRAGRRGGAILFRRNLGGGPSQIAALAREVHAALPSPLLAVDQEGGRVVRLDAPFLRVPPMALVAGRGDEALAERIARRVGVELAALGITVDFAPVLDVDTHATNPVIGDRAFGSDPEVCARFGAAWIRGLQSTGILATAKHFPGHGDSATDSHVDLPIVNQPLERLESVELAPFRAAIAAGVAAMMTAHVVYPAIDSEHPATLSYVICTELRGRLGFQGVLVSDDLEMRAIADRQSSGDAAVLAVAAGCDALLVCQSFEEQERVVDALIQEAERSERFRARCQEAAQRVNAAQRRATARPLDDTAVEALLGGPEAQSLAAEMARRLAG
jgi:beta-N-acetylhexosaminidase